jgi:hypothetical protein
MEQSQRYVVVSSNNNPDYLFYLPYVEKAWANYGWKLCVMITHDVTDYDKRLDSTIVIRLPKVDGLRTETIAQAGRLYAANYLPMDALIMTSDMDLIPLQDYWNPNKEDITVYGHDLTWFSYFPMGYIAMSGASWKHYMNCSYDTANDMLRDAKETGIAFSEEWEKWWNFDWDLVTKRLTHLKQLGGINFVNRGQINIAGATLAKGRVDRYNWEATQNQSEWIDAHCENNNVQHPDKLNKFLKVYNKIHGEI